VPTELPEKQKCEAQTGRADLDICLITDGYTIGDRNPNVLPFYKKLL